MSSPVPEEPPGRKAAPSIFQMWGRETVKDLALVVAAIPMLVTLLYVPVLASHGGSWPALAGLFVLFAAIWWVLRLLLRRWAAAGDRGGDPPSGR